MTFWERYRQLFNRRGSDWWSIVFGYPVGRLGVALIAPMEFITPTALTLLGFAVKVAAAALIWRGSGPIAVTTVILLQVAQVLDSMDGTLARARRSFSYTGAFLDKITDAVGLFAIALAVGVRAAAEHQAPLYAALGGAAGAAFVIVGYMYWFVQTVRRSPASPEAISGAAEIPTWSAIGREWLRGWTRIIRFSEADLYLWICVFAAFGRWQELVIVLLASQSATVGKRAVDHLRTLRQLESARD
jgi:phosphatidylglycerophosphate synthase